MSIPIKLQRGAVEHFFDDTFVASKRKITRRWLPAKINPFPAIEPDRPWEHRALTLYGTSMAQPGGPYRLYYTNWAPSKSPSAVFLAVSDDGFRWTKPELGVVDWQGSRANNIVISPEWHNDGPSVLYDPTDPARPYKCVAFQADSMIDVWGKRWGLYGYESADGVNWSPTDPAMILRAGDRTNLMATRPGGQYVMYTRHPDMMTDAGLRAIYRSESSDFAHWSEPEMVLAPDLAEEPDVEYYGMSVFERNGWLLGLLEVWRSAVDAIEVQLVFSRDGRSWQHPYPREPFIAPTCDWNRKWNSCASNGPIIVNEQMVFYFGGRFVSHHYDSAQQHGCIGYASLPIDRFCALEATAGGQFTTPAIEWPGGGLVVNCDTRESFDSHPGIRDGEITVEVLDQFGSPLPDWSGDSKATFSANTHMRCEVFSGAVNWPGGRTLDELRGKVICLRFGLRHARLFTISAGTPPPSPSVSEGVRGRSG